jgi:hypothetical protein
MGGRPAYREPWLPRGLAAADSEGCHGGEPAGWWWHLSVGGYACGRSGTVLTCLPHRGPHGAASRQSSRERAGRSTQPEGRRDGRSAARRHPRPRAALPGRCNGVVLGCVSLQRPPSTLRLEIAVARSGGLASAGPRALSTWLSRGPRRENEGGLTPGPPSAGSLPGPSVRAGCSTQAGRSAGRTGESVSVPTPEGEVAWIDEVLMMAEPGCMCRVAARLSQNMAKTLVR